MKTTESGEELRKRLLKEALAIPPVPGVYIMHDGNDRVIYVGKSRKLHDRVSQYFMDSEKSVKTERMVSCVRRFEYIVCSTEMEALTLENTLIKQYSPRYNIRLKDAKSYPYIKIPAGKYPRPVMTRRRTDDGGRYFGPYSGTSVVFPVIHTVNRIFGLPSCKKVFPRDIGRDRPCLYYQMGRCCGVCTGKVSEEEYNEKLSAAVALLKGGVYAVKKQLEEKMLQYAEEERYEAAAGCRDTIAALSRLTEHQKAVTAPDVFRDAASLGEQGGVLSLCLLKIRSGAVVDSYCRVIPPDVPDPEAAAQSLLSDYYRMTEDYPSELLLGSGFGEESAEVLSDLLTGLCSRKTRAVLPQRGDGRALTAMAHTNAEEFSSRQSRENSRYESISEKLALLLQLEVVPERIEAYDISNIGSEHITGGMIVAENGAFKKRDYRYFRITGTEGQDDYASMREVLTRRLSKLTEPKEADSSFSSCPDLLLIDGGAQHLAVALEVLDSLGLDIPCAGMVKDGEHRTRALITPSGERDIAKEQDVFVFIYKIQEEIHRFTVSRMSEAKRRTVRHSSLEQIPGIGPKKASLLLSAFGGLEGVRTARPEELSGIRGIHEDDAVAVYRHFHGESEEQT